MTPPDLGGLAANGPSAQLRRFPCAQCGASLVYAPGADRLRCSHCGHENLITPRVDAPILEQDYRRTLQELASAAPARAGAVNHCDSCGASYSFAAATHAGQCPFCGSPAVAQTGQQRQLQPQALLPFQVTREQAWAAFRRWIGGLWFAPGKLKAYARNDASLTGMYVPYWTYDAQTSTSYRGERGDDYQVQEAYRVIENGQEVERVRTVTRTRWTPAAGQVARFFDDVLVLASQSLPRAVTERLEPWDLANLIPYQEEYLSGFQSEMYQVALEQGFARAREIMAVAIQHDIARDIGGDHQRIHAADTRYGDLRFKHILLPVWLSAFRFRAKVYRFVINGRNGEVQGERPYSPWKIALAVLLALLLAGVGLAAWRQYELRMATYSPDPFDRPFQRFERPDNPFREPARIPPPFRYREDAFR